MVKKGPLSPKKGMNRDTHPGELSNEEYSFALNANFQDEHGNGKVILQNEPSNVKCTGFKSGYKVIGHKFDINADRTYFFLTNPTTGCSEIGYVDSITGTEGLEAVEKECDCNISVIIETPQQEEVQNAICQYNTLVTDCCDDFPEAPKCLGFDVNNPIKEGNIIIKDEKIGKKLYWTDNLNPQRHINLDNLDYYYQDVDDCKGDPVDTCLQCDKLRIFPEFNKPCIQIESEEFGGALKAGMYEILISYGSSEGDVISNWYSITNPVSIYDKNNNILDQTNLDYTTSKSIKLQVSDIDDNYDYYNLAVIYKSGLDQATTYKKYGTYPSSTKTVSISSLTDKENTSIQDLLDKKPMYLKAEGLSSANGYLLHNGLTIQREINLQPVVNLMGSLVKWSTVMAPEDLYEDGANVSNYTGYMRDEVVPLSIQFFMDGGYESPVFKFIPRPAKSGEKDVLGSPEFPEDTNTDSVLESFDNCDSISRTERWQFENTAEVIDRCTVPSTPGVTETTETRTEEQTCVVNTDGIPEVLDTVASGTLNIGEVNDIVVYVNNNAASIIASSDPSLAAIKDVLEDPTDYPEACTPDFGDNCGAPSLGSEEMIAISVEDQELSEVLSEDTDDYDRMSAPTGCGIFETDSSGDIVEDTPFMTSWMRSGETVYSRNNPFTNNNCSSASSVQNLPSNLFLQNEGSSGITGLQQSALNVSQTSLPEYTSKLHTNALWYKVDFNGQDYAVVEISNSICNNPDDNNNQSIRVNVFEDCSATSDLSAYSTIISDISLSPDPDKYIFLDATDFPSGSAHIAIDSAMKREVDYELQLSGTSGEITVTIDGQNYSMVFNTDLATTASDFVSTHSAALLSNHNIIATAVGDNVSLRADRSYVALTSTTPVSGDLAASIVIVESYDTLMPPCGCFSIRTQEPVTEYEVTFTNLKFGKRQTYISECEFTIPTIKGCDPIPYEKGYFSYWESTEKYLCNKELYDSSKLKVSKSIIDGLDTQDQSDFEDYYTNSGAVDVDGNYEIISEANFMDKPIRHFKFPDSKVSPFMSDYDMKPEGFSDSVIFPIGFNIDNKVVSAFLDVAVDNGLISLEERLKINKYEVFRGDRRTDKSIIAKGILFDNYKYSEDGEDVYYPNFPLNTLGGDNYNNVSHPFNSASNNKFTFHSPEIHFYKPTIPNELNIEGYVFGKSYTIFDEVEDHPTYVLLGNPAYNLATGLAIAEITLDAVAQTSDWLITATSAGTEINASISVPAAISAGASFISALLFKQGELKYKWLTIFRDLGDPQNFTYYSASVGKYNFIRPNTDVSGSKYRGIQSSNYLKSGYWEVEEEFNNTSVNVNNLDREDSLFLSLGPSSYNIDYPSYYSNYDNFNVDPFNSSRVLYSGEGRSPKIEANCASPYVGLKRYLPSQYGTVNSIEWVSTGYCGDLSESSDCDPIFGGDTYISRFAVKRKIPFFTQNAMGLAPLTPYKYSDYFNINSEDDPNNKYYLDYLVTNTGSFSVLNLPQSKSEFNLFPPISSEDFYIKPSDGKFFLFSYGFPYFLVESQINCNYRYAKREIAENFYPNFKDIIENTQEKNISIREPNTYFYNPVYSSAHTRSAFRLLPPNYSREIYDRISEPGNSVIYSRKDGSETSTYDPWLSYRSADAYDFPKSYGDLVSMDDIGSEQILGRFTNGITIFGALDMLADRIAPETKNIGTGGIFTGRNVNFNKTDLGYAGTQHTQMVNTDFGHFWADAKRGKVFKLEPNGQGLGEITIGLEKWFKENLPFKILKSLPEVDIDNNYKGIGLSMGWDDRLKRLFLTKLDYIYTGDQGEVEYLDGDFIDSQTREVINIDESDLFEKCNWTAAYSPLTESWISYYSFKPNYYVNYHNYFQTGLNTDDATFGLWSHLSFLSSYQVFYGSLNPFTIEYPNQTKLVNSLIHDVEFYLDVRKYYNKYDYTDIYGQGFNKAVVYNNHQNTGLLNLVPQKDNDMRQLLDYPKFNSNSIDILQSEIHNKWSFNYLYNAIKDEKAGLPIWINDCSQVEKTLDDRLLNYKSTFKDRMRGDYFLIRLTQDIESRYKMLFRFAIEQRDFYEQ